MRNLLILAHADDEVIGAASLLLREPADCFLFYLTDSAPDNPYFLERAGFATREAYREQRHRELFAALELVGVERRQVVILPVPDQLASRHVKASVAAVREVIDELQPERVFTHAYEGGHPDHDAAAVVASRCGHRQVFELPYYHAATGVMTAGDFVSSTGAEQEWVLTADEEAAKQRLWDEFVSQKHIFARFRRGLERYRPVPAHDFTQPPHPRPLYYETRPVGWNFEQWSEAVRSV